jgi:hypothetical protein
VYELVVCIVLRCGQGGLADDLIVDHPGQPADYTHMDGTVWTWHQGWRLVGGFRDDKAQTFGRFRNHVRAYDLVS